MVTQFVNTVGCTAADVVVSIVVTSLSDGSVVPLLGRRRLKAVIPRTKRVDDVCIPCALHYAPMCTLLASGMWTECTFGSGPHFCKRFEGI